MFICSRHQSTPEPLTRLSTFSWGNALKVQRLGLSAFPAGAWVQSLVRELRTRKQSVTAKAATRALLSKRSHPFGNRTSPARLSLQNLGVLGLPRTTFQLRTPACRVQGCLLSWFLTSLWWKSSFKIAYTGLALRRGLLAPLSLALSVGAPALQTVPRSRSRALPAPGAWPLFSFQSILLHQEDKLPRFRGLPTPSLLKPLTTGPPQSEDS